MAKSFFGMSVCAARGCRQPVETKFGRRVPFCSEHWQALQGHFTRAVMGALEAWIELPENSRRDQLVSAIWEAAMSLPALPGVKVCSSCGCSEDLACPGGCFWIDRAPSEPPLCSACV